MTNQQEFDSVGVSFHTTDTTGRLFERRRLMRSNSSGLAEKQNKEIEENHVSQGWHENLK